MDVDFFCSVCSSDRTPIYYREIKLRSKESIYAAFRGSGIDEGIRIRYSRYRRRGGLAENVLGVKADIHQ